MNENNLKYEDIKLISLPNGGVRLENPVLFKEYHDSKAHLRIIRSDYNLKKCIY